MKLALLVNKEFREAAARLAQQTIPLATSFKLKGMLKRIDEEFTKYEECRGEALKRFGKRDDKGDLIQDESGNVHFTREGLLEFSAELQELAQSDVEIGTVKISELGSKVELSPNELSLLEAMLEES